MAKQTFAPIPNSLLERTDISHGAKLCCGRLIQYAGKNGIAYPKIETLAQQIGSSKQAVIRFIKELKEHKILTTKRQGLGKPNIYYLSSSVLIHSSVPEVSKMKLLQISKSNPTESSKSTPPYTKEERDNLKREVEKITGSLVDKFRV